VIEHKHPDYKDPDEDDKKAVPNDFKTDIMALDDMFPKDQRSSVIRRHDNGTEIIIPKKKKEPITHYHGDEYAQYGEDAKGPGAKAAAANKDKDKKEEGNEKKRKRKTNIVD